VAEAECQDKNVEVIKACRLQPASALDMTAEPEQTITQRRGTSRRERASRFHRTLYVYRLFVPHDSVDFDMGWQVPQRITQRDDHRHQIAGWLAPEDEETFGRAYLAHLERMPGCIGAKSSFGMSSSSSGPILTVMPKTGQLHRDTMVAELPKVAAASEFEADFGVTVQSSSSGWMPLTSKASAVKRQAPSQTGGVAKRARTMSDSDEDE
jgi:hypothetical protein